MFNNEQYLSAALRSTLRSGVSNQYIDCAGLQSAVWSDFGDWEIKAGAIILQDVIGCGHFGMVWRGKYQVHNKILRRWLGGYGVGLMIERSQVLFPVGTLPGACQLSLPSLRSRKIEYQLTGWG